MITNEETTQSGFYQEDENNQSYILTQKHQQGLHLNKRLIMIKYIVRTRLCMS